jgi:hypothetical protein
MLRPAGGGSKVLKELNLDEEKVSAAPSPQYQQRLKFFADTGSSI